MPCFDWYIIKVMSIIDPYKSDVISIIKAIKKKNLLCSYLLTVINHMHTINTLKKKKKKSHADINFDWRSQTNGVFCLLYSISNK